MNDINKLKFSVKEWLITFIIMLIPLVNIIYLLMWAFRENDEPRKSFSRAYLILLSTLITFSIIIFLIGLISELFNPTYTNSVDEYIDLNEIVIESIHFEQGGYEDQIIVESEVAIAEGIDINSLNYTINFKDNRNLILHTETIYHSSKMQGENSYRLIDYVWTKGLFQTSEVVDVDIVIEFAY